MLEIILECYPEEIFPVVAGLDDAIIGVDEKEMRLIYSVKKCYEILSEDMTLDEAKDYFEYNIHHSSYYGNSPIWCCDNF